MAFFETDLVIKSKNISILVDVSQSENHSHNKEVTSHPIEDGSQISDHTIIRPLEVSLQGVVSDTPTGLIGLIKRASQGISTVGNLLGGSFPESISKDAHDSLIELAKGNELIELVTGLTSYKNMVMSNLRFIRNPQTTGGITFSATFKQITKVQSRTALTSLSRTVTGLNADSQTSTGLKQPKQVSYLKQIANWATKIVP